MCSSDLDFNLIVGKNQIKLNLKRIIEERLELKIKDYMPTALCVAEQVLTQEERQLGCVLVDFGAETITISIYKNEALTYLFTIPLGSRNITRDITSLNMVEESAENLKKTIGDAINTNSESGLISTEGVSAKDVGDYIVARSDRKSVV